MLGTESSRAEALPAASRCPFHRLLAGLTSPQLFRSRAEIREEISRSPELVRKEIPPGRYRERDLRLVRELLDGIDLDPRLLIPNMFLAQIAAPRIAEILNRTGQVTGHTGERFEITSSFLFAMPRNPASPESQAAMRRVKILHDRAGVDPNSPEFHYGIYCFTAKFVEMLRKFDTTPPTNAQERAWFSVWRTVASQLGATNVPADYENFKRESREFESAILANPSELSRTFAHGIMDRVLKLFPAPTRSLTAGLILSMVDPPLIEALSLPPPPELERSAVREVLRLFSKIIRFGRDLS